MYPQTPAPITLLEMIKVADAPRTIIFNSIPNTFNHLLVLGNLRSVGISQGGYDFTNLYFNDDRTDANYDWVTRYGGPSTGGDGGAYSFFGMASAQDASVLHYSPFKISFPFYNANTYKNWIYHCNNYRTGGAQWNYQGAGRWKNQAVVRSIAFLPRQGTAWDVGSCLSLYGML